MAEQTKSSLNRWSQIGLSLIFIANIVLVWVLWQTRLARISLLANDTPFFSSYFILVSLSASSLILISFIFIFSQKARNLVTSMMVWIWIIVSLFGLVTANIFVPAVSIYFAAFLFWLILIDCGLLLFTYSDALAAIDTVVFRRNLLTIGFSILVTLVLLEILLRVYFSVMGTEQQKVAYLYNLDRILEVSNRYAGQPYINYGLVSAHSEHNSRGYRGEEFSIPKDEGIYRIFALGGSTTYGDSVLPEESYPAVLQSILHDVYGYTHIEVVNAGVNAYSSFDSLANLTYHVLDDEPDMIIVYHGVNDVRTRLADPSQYTGLNLQRGYWNTSALRNQINPSVLIRFSSINLGFSPNLSRFETLLSTSNPVPRCGFFETTCSELDDRPAAEIIAQNPPIYFERNYRNMAAIAAAHNVDVVFSTWQYYSGELELPNPMSLDHMQAAVDEQNILLLEFAPELAVPVMDIANSDVLDNSEFWIDGMHMTPLGTYEQAAFYAAYLIENNLLPSPPAN